MIRLLLTLISVLSFEVMSVVHSEVYAEGPCGFPIVIKPRGG